MLSIVGLAPHPPIIIPEIGRGELKNAEQTVEGMKLLGKKIKAAEPELLIIITPHGQIMRGGPAVLTPDQLVGDFGQFGFPNIKIKMQTDRRLVELLKAETENKSLRPVFLDDRDHRFRTGKILDHGAMVPLYYLEKAGVRVPGLHITFSFDPYRELYRFGQVLARVIDKRGAKTAVLASGDLSHRLIPGAPAGYSPKGAEYDRLLVELIREGRVEDILNIDQGLVEEAGECGLRSFTIALGMLGGEGFKPEIISYEGPFGVGYLVAALYPEHGDWHSVSEEEVSKHHLKDEHSGRHLNPAELARRILEHYLEEGRLPQLPRPLSPKYGEKAGVFVSLKKGDQLRGCIGTVEPARENLAEEITANAVGAAVKDPRFPPVTREELPQLNISVDVLGPVEAVKSEKELDPKRYGVLVRCGSRSGLLLPDLKGVDTVNDQLDIACRKAGIAQDESVDLYRFIVTRYGEK